MVVWRRWIFPVLLVIVFGLIAASLTKLAFFGSPAEGPLQPGGQVTDPVVAVERGTIVNELSLRGTVARDADVTVRSNVNGSVTKVNVASGANVSAGDVLFTVKQDYPETLVNVTAPEAGTIGELPVFAGQSVSAGQEVTKLTPNRFHVLATVEPVMLYRLLNAPSEARVTITGGPAPFACTNLTTQVATDGVTSVRCNVPGDQVVFPGLPAQLDIAVGTAENVLAIPTTAVKGGSGTGVVWLVTGDEEPVETRVTLGVTDGTLVEILDGVGEGDRIRQFVPGSAAPVQEYCYDIAPGKQQCETGVNW